MRQVIRAILAGGFIAGTVDIGAASLIFAQRPARILCNIAGGLVGEAAAHSGGARMAILGLALQWLMSLLIAAIFCVAALYWRRLLERPLVAGVLYGVIIFFVMNYVVVPMSAIARVPHFSPLLFALNLAAMIIFGLIVAATAYRIMRPAPLGE